VNRVYGLDIFRAFAILVVLYGHGMDLVPPGVVALLGSLEVDGVNVFFILSGFLIGGILIRTLEKEGIAFKTLFRFMLNRWIRTLPPYYLVLIFLVGYYQFTQKWEYGYTVMDVRRYFLFIQNLNYPHPGFFPEAWSLAVEEWFYLVVPFAAFVAARFLKPKQAIFGVLLLIMSLSAIIRYIKLSEGIPLESIDLRRQVVARLDSLIYGVLGAWINHYYHAFWIKWKGNYFVFGIILFLIISRILTPVYSNNLFYNVISFSFISVAILLTLPFMSQIKNGEGLIYRFITFISLISYSLYLVHYTIVQGIIIPSLPGSNWKVGYCLYWIISIFLAGILYYNFEKPIMRLRHKLNH